MSKPFLKWPGSKRALITKITKTIPKKGKLLIEPFCGSCSFSLATNYQAHIINDVNPDLIEMFRMIVDDPRGFINDSKKLFAKENNHKDAYYSFRESFNKEKDPYTRAMLFHYLLRHGYNGLCRYSSNGFNVPFGSYTKVYFPEQEILYFACKLANAEFTCMSFHELLSMDFEEATIFNDPPYVSLSPTSSFTSYAPCSFDDSDHLKLNELCTKQSLDGNDAYVCNNRVPIIEELYPNKTSHVNYFASRTIAARGKSRKKVKETLLHYKGQKAS